MQIIWPSALDHFCPSSHYLNIDGRSSQVMLRAKYHGYRMWLQTRRCFMFSFYKPMWNTVGPDYGPWTIMYSKPWKRLTMWCYIPNIKDVGLVVPGKKIVKVFIPKIYFRPFCSIYTTDWDHLNNYQRGLKFGPNPDRSNAFEAIVDYAPWMTDDTWQTTDIQLSKNKTN